MLVAVEVAVSVALVLMTGLVTASVVKLMRVDRGFDATRTVAARVELPQGAYKNTLARAEFLREVLGKLKQLPGVEHAAIGMQLPLDGEGWGDSAQLPGDTRPWTALPSENFRWVSPDYFATIHLRLLAGQVFSPSDWGRPLAVISERTAQTLWPGRSPIGQQFHRGGSPGEAPFTVVGVIANARTVTLEKPDPMLIYVPYWYRCNDEAALMVRTKQDPSAMADEIRKTIRGLDAGVPVTEVRALGAQVGDSIANRRFEMDLLVLFAASALLLAGLGVYGVVTYSVVQRQREIGLRLALGAQRENIYGLVLRDGLAPVVMGAAAGVALAFGLARLAASLLFGVSPYDPWIALASICVLIAVGAAGCLLPARRAASVEPMEALRSE